VPEDSVPEDLVEVSSPGSALWGFAVPLVVFVVLVVLMAPPVSVLRRVVTWSGSDPSE
jgi:hypothetical protein